MAKLAIVVVTYKTRDLVLQAIESAYQAFSGPADALHIVVVDNHSQDGTAQALNEHFPQVQVIENSENRGPAYAFNRGVEAALDTAPYILVMNSDIRFLDHAIDQMLAYLDCHPDVSGCPAHFLNEDMTEQAGHYHITRIGRLDYSRPFNVTHIGTTCAMIRREAFQAIGGYDECYYFYNEDVDWSQRAVRAGMRFMYVPEARVIHYVSKGRRQNNARIIRELYKSNLYYYRKFYPRIAFLMYLGMKLEIRLKARQTRRELSKPGCPPSRHRELSELLEAYRDSSVALTRELKNPRQPIIPTFGA